MSKLTIKSGQGELTLKKSQNLVGLKTTDPDKDAAQSDFVESEVFKNLGGFNVVTLKHDEQTLDDKLDEVRSLDEVAQGTHVYFAEGSQKPLIPTGELFITFHIGVTEPEQQIVLDEYRLELIERRDPVTIVAKVTAQSPNPLKVAAALQNIAMVKSAEPDMDSPLDAYFSAPGDNLLPNEWHLENPGYVVDVNFKLKKGADAKVMDAWRRLGNMGSGQVTVALIDNGFDLTHPDLKDKVYKPYDVWANSSSILQGDARYTHGTPCASVAIAASNGQGIVGAAPAARFMPVSGTSFSVRDTETMFDYCIKNGADIISCSWGTTDTSQRLNTLKEAAIAKAAKEGRNGKGCVILFAAGNEDLDYLNFYAAHPDVIAVGATTSLDEHASYSNRGKELSVCAPSNGDGQWPIIAARAWWDPGLSGETGEYRFWRDGRSRGDMYKHFGGTSSATPLVAGICALILSANPDLTAREVKEILQSTADKIGQSYEYTGGHSLKYGYGRVNADKAVAEALRRKEAAKPVVVEVSQGISSGQGLFRFGVTKQEAVGWGIQIGAFFDYGNVLIQAEKLQKQFNQPIVVSINELSGKTVYKVVVGAFSQKADADKLGQTVKAGGYSGAFTRNLADLA